MVSRPLSLLCAYTCVTTDSRDAPGPSPGMSSTPSRMCYGTGLSVRARSLLVYGNRLLSRSGYPPAIWVKSLNLGGVLLDKKIIALWPFVLRVLGVHRV